MSLFYINIKKALALATVILSVTLTANAQDFEYDDIRYSVIDMEGKTCRAKKSVKSLSKSLTIRHVCQTARLSTP